MTDPLRDARVQTTCCGCGARLPVIEHDGIVTFSPCPICDPGEYRLVETGPPGATYTAPRWYPGGRAQ